jgi:hypothetical protein
MEKVHERRSMRRRLNRGRARIMWIWPTEVKGL